MPSLSPNYPDNGSPQMQLEELLRSSAEPTPTLNPTGTRAAKRRALCIGINHYPSAPLMGCVSDARRWSEWFQQAGFQTESLLDEQATRQQILSSISSMVQGAAVGDVVAIQYSGHGTQLPDLDGDELDGDTPNYDEALVPVDYLQNGFVIDDDIAAIANGIADGVNVTFIFDCCHSGTSTRMVGGRSRASSKDALPRFLKATADMIKVHKRSRSQSRSLSGSNNLPSLPRTPENHREILFAACRSDQVAWESDGQGDFTRIALEVLASSGGKLTNNQFVAQVNSSFGETPRQNPAVTCNERLRDHPLLGVPVNTPVANGNSLQELVRSLRSLVDKLQAEVG